jgi:L-fuculose-phosphate aldolase
VPMTEPSLDRARRDICEIGRSLWQRSMVAANDGNISVRVGDAVVCTPTGVSKGFLTPETLTVLGLDGTFISGDRPPSSEVKMHLRVYELDRAVGAVVHAHPVFATMWAIKGEGLRCRMLPETIVTMPDVPLAPYATPSTAQVPDSIGPLVSGHKACLLEQHGALTWGADLMQAYLTMERLEYTAELMWRLRAAGAERELDEASIDRIHELFTVPAKAS